MTHPSKISIGENCPYFSKFKLFGKSSQQKKQTSEIRENQSLDFT